MSENQTVVFPDVIKASSEAIQQNLPETAGQADGALSTVVGFFNNVVLYPVKKANLTFCYKLEAFEDDLREKIKDIPEENLQAPPTMITGPTLEALRYAYDEEELRDMFENLLASSMDDRIASEVRPSFVHAIKQMSPLDAKVLSEIVNARQLKCARITFGIRGTNRVYAGGMPSHFVVELCDLADPFLVSSSIDNLERLALIEIDNGLTGEGYGCLLEHPYVKERQAQFEGLGKEVDAKTRQQSLGITDYGMQFARTCLGK